MARCKRVVIALAVLSVLAGCGRRGALEPPPDPQAQVSGERADALPRRPKPVPVARPSEPFILDPIL